MQDESTIDRKEFLARVAARKDHELVRYPRGVLQRVPMLEADREWLMECGLPQGFGAPLWFPHGEEEDSDQPSCEIGQLLGEDHPTIPNEHELLVLGEALIPFGASHDSDLVCLRADWPGVFRLSARPPFHFQLINSSVRQMALCALVYREVADEGREYAEMHGWEGGGCFSYRHPIRFVADIQERIRAIDPAAMNEGSYWPAHFAEMEENRRIDERLVKPIDEFDPQNEAWTFRHLTRAAKKDEGDDMWPAALERQARHLMDMAASLPRELAPVIQSSGLLHDGVIVAADFDRSDATLAMQAHMMGNSPSGLEYSRVTMTYRGVQLSEDEIRYIGLILDYPQTPSILDNELDIVQPGLFIHRFRFYLPTALDGSRNPEVAIIFQGADVEVRPDPEIEHRFSFHRVPVFQKC